MGKLTSLTSCSSAPPSGPSPVPFELVALSPYVLVGPLCLSLSSFLTPPQTLFLLCVSLSPASLRFCRHLTFWHLPIFCAPKRACFLCLRVCASELTCFSVSLSECPYSQKPYNSGMPGRSGLSENGAWDSHPRSRGG